MRNSKLWIAILIMACRQSPGGSSSPDASATGPSQTPGRRADPAAPSAIPDAGGGGAAARLPGPCEREDVVRITPLSKEARPVLRIEPDPGHNTAIRQAELDLDGRNQLDLYVLFPEDFGSDGAQVQALYAHCKDDRYAPVWGPEYTLELKALDTRFNGWREVKRREKVGTHEKPDIAWYVMRFQEFTYQDRP
jgi:hypothetical protein